MKTVLIAPINIAIIEDNRFIRKGFEIMLNSQPAFKLIGSYQDCEEAFTKVEIKEAKIILMDIKLPGISGIEGIKYLKNRFPEMLIIVCTAFEDDENIFKAIAAGAVGFISKKTSPKELLSTLQNVLKGGSPITPNVARNILASFAKQIKKSLKAESPLTAIENNILEKISIGKSYINVANELSVTEEEVLLQIRLIYEKLQERLVHLT